LEGFCLSNTFFWGKEKKMNVAFNELHSW